MPTMKEVARAADVSVATVSHVINKTRFVSPELAARVESAMLELGYRPDGTARSLRLRRTQTIGLVIPDNSNPFFAELSRVIEDEGFAAGYTTIFGNSNERADRELDYVQTLLSKRVDGLIAAPSLQAGEELGELLDSVSIPVVLIDREVPLPRADVVLYDNAGGSYDATRHLVELGHRAIGCIAGPPGLGPAAARLEGFRRALDEAGVRSDLVVEADFHYEGGRDAVARLLDLRAPLTAIVAANDLMMAGALRDLATRGLRVPSDISMVGFDDAPLAEMISPSFTTVRQPLEAMARTAVSALLRRLDGDGGPPERHVLPTELVIRETTANLPT